MKKTSLLLLGLISGIALTSCGSTSFNECIYVKANDKLYTSFNTDTNMLTLVLEYLPIEKDDGSAPANNEHIFIFMPVRKDETSYKIDNRLTYTNNGPLNYGKLDLVKVIGTYLSYRKVYVSSDKKSFKVEYVRYEPIDAPYDNEAQGNYAFHIAKGDEIEYINTFSTNEVIEVDRKFEFEYMVMF